MIERLLDLSNYVTDIRKSRRKVGKSGGGGSQEFFTPYSIVKRMGDKIPEEDWADPTKTFLEPCFGNGGKKFDICLMNPPYNNGVSNTFLNKILDLTNELITVQPESYLFKGKNGIPKIKEKLSNGYTNIENIDANNYFDGAFQGKIGILHFSTNKDKQLIIHNKKLDTLDNIRPYFDDDLICQFADIIKPLKENDNAGYKWYGTPGSHYADRFVKIEDENPNCWCVQCVMLRGNVAPQHKTGKADDFYTFIPRNEQLINTQFIGQYKDLIKLKNNKNKLKLQYYFKFNTEKEARGLLNYFKTDFARACLYLEKKDMNMYWIHIPWFDFSQDIFSKSPREIDDYLFNKYKISDEIRNHIEEILPDYYNIRS